MAKSVNEYYSEKMQKLLEMQKSQNTATLASPTAKSNDGQKRPVGGRGYYEEFKTRVRPNADGKQQGQQRGAPARPSAASHRTAGSKIPPGRHGVRAGERDQRQNESPRPKINPEQTTRDRMEEYLRSVEAMRTAKRARVLRKVRDGIISCALIIAVFSVMCVVVYRLLFVINDLSAEGGERYGSDELVAASGVNEGDHLFSFSSKDVGKLITLRCPEIASVDVERTPPGKIVFNVTEESPAFYADFYGEYRKLSGSLRVLGSVTEEEAKGEGCIKLLIPDIIKATAGETPEFKNVRDEDYIYDVSAAVVASSLGERAGKLDLSDKYNMTLTVDGKYIIKLGDGESIETKLRIAEAVLEDEMFDGDVKATIDVTDLSETGVVVDQGLKIE